VGEEVITSAVTPVCIGRNASTMPDERGLKTLSLSARLKLDFIIALERSERVTIWLRCDLNELRNCAEGRPKVVGILPLTSLGLASGLPCI